MGVTAINFTDPPRRSSSPSPTRRRWSPVTRIAGGDWSTYWHNGKLYEADIRRGLLIWDLNDERENRGQDTGRLLTTRRPR